MCVHQPLLMLVVLVHYPLWDVRSPVKVVSSLRHQLQVVDVVLHPDGCQSLQVVGHLTHHDLVSRCPPPKPALVQLDPSRFFPQYHLGKK